MYVVSVVYICRVIIKFNKMKSVSREYFFSKIRELNVSVAPKGSYPYGTLFKLKNSNKIIGKSIGEKYYTDL